MITLLAMVILSSAVSANNDVNGIALAYDSHAFDDDHDDALKAIKRGEILSYDRIKSVAERELGGKMVGERLRRTNQGWVYEVRVRRNDGKVVFAIINAGSGKVISKR
ncbi:PepSY domain-containing protein [Kordiimonas sp. SCSIO 12610]|uniref:PepSY domain-containing protein n=1 Tax=Kordiimonas sp. SCSIO 12610 TaxID=2829597 RepID=UPI00210DC60F|nr:PepSY domain-containing protein [Kordiimonas sp. SCSIO 12610]UTW56359.1 PepSY domain-containing protein [Kordiimonas sp. SCSIO 12610]